MKFSPSPSEIELAHRFSAAIAIVFTDMASTEHPMETASIEGEINALTRPSDNSVVNLAHKILDDKIAGTVADFIDSTRQFFIDETRARKAAEVSDLITSLHSQRNSLGNSPSINEARRLQSIFKDFCAAHPLRVDSEENTTFAAGSEAKPF